MELQLARVFTTVLATLFLAAVALKTLFPGDDPYRCRALQNTGRWIDPSRDEQGNRNSFQQWQPDGYIFNNYHSDDIRRCMEGRPIVIVGDSTSQHVLHALNRLLDKRRSNNDRKQKKLPRAQAFNVTYHGQLVQRLPNAWVSSHGVPGQEYFIQNLELYAEEKRNLPFIEDQEGPAIIYVAAGIWFTKQKGTVNADAAGNVPWATRFGVFKNHFTNLSKFISNNTPRYDPFTAPMDPYDGIGNQVFYAPATEPSYQGHNPGRIDGINRKKAEVVDMQNWLHDTNSTGLPIIWSVVGVTTGENKTWSDPLGTGFHVIPQIAETRANIILNMRCNAKLDRMKSYPYSRTCCTDYGGKPVTQLGLVAFGIIYLVACIVCEVLDLFANREKPQWRLLNMHAGSLALAILMCYYADRTQMMAKGSKLWQLNDFIILCVLCIAILLITIRSSRPPPPGDLSLTREENNQSFLSRDQTEEWKGWMQCFILIYQWTGAHGGFIYVLLRLCVAAYLFQTGYGHTFYFITKNDFSFNRVATIMLRLNILSCVLVYFMDTDYQFYHFSPLVSFWFLVIYGTMAIGGKRFNSNTQVVLAKICISCALVSVIFIKTPFTEWAFSLLQTVFNIQWSSAKWQYHVTLDIFIVYVGMVAATISHEMRMRDISITLGLRLIFALAGIFATFYYFNATAHQSTETYKVWHPYISFIPVFAFIALRNISGSVRNHQSRAMAWLGRCSLETYILHVHLLLAADSEGIIIIDGLFGDGSLLRDRWRTLLIVVPLFIWVSHAAGSATTYIVNLIVHQTPQYEKLDDMAFRWAERIPGSAHISVPQLRVAFIIVVMWILNLISPVRETTLSPDGGHHIRVAPRPPLEVPY